jgi:diacylglycerol O-acyltransferase / wax synthase
MERLSGMDATFLYVETPAGHMHVAMTGIYDVSTMEGGYSFDKIKETIAQRLPLVPPFRRRLVEVPFQFHHPVWIEDPNFNLDYHVRRIGCPAPGGRRELAEVAGQIASIPLDRTRPLWEAWVIEGLKHDRIGFVVKVHHSAIDGASGAEIMTELYDLSPEGRVVEADSVEPEHVPTDLELVSFAAVSKLRLYRDTIGLIDRTVRSVATLISNARNPLVKHGAIPLTAPRTPFNQSISPHRSVAFARLPLDEVRAVKDALGVKVNDIVLAVCAGTLRNYLDGLDALPAEPLIAVVPVSVRDDDERGTQGNKVSAMFTSLATDVEDVGERLAAISASTEGAKGDHNAIGARTLTDWAEWAAPRTFGLAARLYSSMNLANSHRPIHNLVISNVPGPPFPLYLAGAEMVAAYPMGPIMDGAGLNITVLSYREHVDIGFLACRDLVGDIWDLAAAVEPAFEELKQLAGVVDPTITKGPAPVTATSARAKKAATSTRKKPAKKAAPRKATGARL